MNEHLKSEHQKSVLKLMNTIRNLGDLPSLPTKPAIPDGKMILAQAKLIWEEVFELFDACNIAVVLKQELGEKTAILPVDIDLHILDYPEDLDLPHIAKEIADISVVNTGMACEFGISDLPVLEAVDDNNLAKFGPGGYLDKNRKWRKPPDHPSPDLRKVLADQGWEGDGNETQGAEAAVVQSSSQG